MPSLDIRKGMPSVELSRDEFERRYRARFTDPAFRPLQHHRDEAFQEETRNVARALGSAVKLSRAGKYEDPGKGLLDPKPK